MAEHGIHTVRVQTPSRMVTLPWDGAQEFVARCLAAYPTVHPVVEQFRARGVSRPVELTDPNDITFVLAVIEAPARDSRTPRRPARRFGHWVRLSRRLMAVSERRSHGGR
jgi:hypothetical protein